jgi:hypothetical protein
MSTSVEIQPSETIRAVADPRLSLTLAFVLLSGFKFFTLIG